MPEDTELESALDGASLLELVSFDLHLEVLPFSGAATAGTVRLLVNDSGSNDTVDTDCKRDWARAIFESFEGKDVSPEEVDGFAGESIVPVLPMVPVLSQYPFPSLEVISSEGGTSVRGVSR